MGSGIPTFFQWWCTRRSAGPPKRSPTGNRILCRVWRLPWLRPVAPGSRIPPPTAVRGLSHRSRSSTSELADSSYPTGSPESRPTFRSRHFSNPIRGSAIPIFWLCLLYSYFMYSFNCPKTNKLIHLNHK
jgi:hypothetical protein